MDSEQTTPDKVTVELTWHQLEAIVVAELQAAIERLFVLEYDKDKNLIPLDQRYLESFLAVLEKYMGMNDHQVYADTIRNRKQL